MLSVSVLTEATVYTGGGDGDWFRESFSQHCFNALLQLSVATTRNRGVPESYFPLPKPSLMHSPLPSLPWVGASSSAAVLEHWVNHCRESLELFSQEEAVSRGVPLPRARLTDVLTTLHSIVSLVTALQQRQDRGGH